MKKIIQIIKKNIVGFILGVIVAIVISSYAATQLASSSVYYNNANSGGSSNTVSGALDELYELAKTTEFKVGDYVSMTPTKTSFTVPMTLTGYTSNQTINPSELNLWRVIRINSDNTVDMVSEYVSSTLVYFEGPTGYKNFVGTLNYIAKQYENKKCTSGSRHIGFLAPDMQTEYITNTSALTATTAPRSSSTSISNYTTVTEAKGLGDMGYEIDYNLVNTALGTLVAKTVGTTTAVNWWMNSRYYNYGSSTSWNFQFRYIGTDGTLKNCSTYNGANGTVTERKAAIRPILTLKSGVKASSGSGTSASPYVLS